MAFPLPDIEAPETREFWAAAADGRLVIPRCSGCGVWNWYPAKTCTDCQSDDMPWTDTSGRASLFSWAVVGHRLLGAYQPMLPYTTGIVALEEDQAVRIVTTIVDADPARLEMDMPMRVVFRPLAIEGADPGLLAPMFTPAL
ncbi:MAG: OB-fold domain-containing protein [Deltaproteobacteria bacterium]|jgi:uncharacterized OB-fold protein